MQLLRRRLKRVSARGLKTPPITLTLGDISGASFDVLFLAQVHADFRLICHPPNLTRHHLLL